MLCSDIWNVEKKHYSEGVSQGPCHINTCMRVLFPSLPVLLCRSAQELAIQSRYLASQISGRRWGHIGEPLALHHFCAVHRYRSSTDLRAPSHSWSASNLELSRGSLWNPPGTWNSGLKSRRQLLTLLGRAPTRRIRTQTRILCEDMKERVSFDLLMMNAELTQRGPWTAPLSIWLTFRDGGGW